MKTYKMIFALACIAPALAFLPSCEKDVNNSAHMRFMLTDAPGDYEAVNVDIVGIDVHTEGSAWMHFDSDIGVVNLLEYANGRTILITEGEVEAGNINGIRLLLGERNSVVIDGKTIELKVPSGQESGLKIDLASKIEAGGSYEWTLDFDAGQSVVEHGNGDFHLKPVIRLLGSTEISAGGGASGSVVVTADAGAIKGRVVGLATLAYITAKDEAGNLVTTVTDAAGYFEVSALHQGSYEVTVDPLGVGINAMTYTHVNVTAGAATELGVIQF